MFLSHYGVALALKRAVPKVSLGTLFVAGQLVDLLWGCFLLLGWEHARIEPGYTPVTPLEFVDYPITHSLVAALAWAGVATALYYSWPTRDTSRHWQASVVVGLAVASHYVLDAIAHLPDLPLAGNDSRKIGLGLWTSLGATLAVELLIFAAGLAVYATFSSRRHPLRPGRLLLVAVLLLGTYLAAVFGPPPPSIPVVAASAITIVIAMGVLGGWADRRATDKELAAGAAGSR